MSQIQSSLGNRNDNLMVDQQRLQVQSPLSSPVSWCCSPGGKGELLSHSSMSRSARSRDRSRKCRRDVHGGNKDHAFGDAAVRDAPSTCGVMWMYSRCCWYGKSNIPYEIHAGSWSENAVRAMKPYSACRARNGITNFSAVWWAKNSRPSNLSDRLRVRRRALGFREPS